MFGVGSVKIEWVGINYKFNKIIQLKNVINIITKCKQKKQFSLLLMVIANYILIIVTMPTPKWLIITLDNIFIFPK